MREIESVCGCVCACDKISIAYPYVFVSVLGSLRDGTP